MPFPYAYYKEEYNGPLHGTRVEAPAFYMLHSTVSSSGDLDVAGKSHISIDTTAGDVTITGFSGGLDGQILRINKPSSANNIIFEDSSGGAQQIKLSREENLTLPVNTMGGISFICKEEGPLYVWYQTDGLNVLNNGTAIKPSLLFGGDPDTGLFREGPNAIGFSAGGIQRFKVGANEIRSEVVHRFSDGSISSPAISFTGDTDTGFYKELENVYMSADGQNCFNFHKEGWIGMYKNSGIRTDLALLLSQVDPNIPQEIRTGAVMASDSFADSSQVPVNGIYSKGNVKTSGQFQGTATSALFADLAERYETDKKYPLGTIVQIGGEKEITAATDDAFGVLSTDPALMMNSQAGDNETHPYVGLVGRVPCRVIGEVRKGDKIGLSQIEGVGVSLGKRVQCCDIVVGVALRDKKIKEQALVEIAIGGVR